MAGPPPRARPRTLADLGVSEATCGAPVRSSMEVVQLTTTAQGLPVYLDKHASQADHLVVFNRVKPHTALQGEVQSGLHKMLLIGLGKQKGAEAYHRAFFAHRFEDIARSVGQAVITKGRVLMGLAVVENALEQTAIVEAVEPQDFWARDEALLVQATQWLPRLPFLEADLLIVDEFGKDISGSGMDTNVVGRKNVFGPSQEEGMPRVTAVYVRDLTEASHGNATGIGRAEFTHQRLVDKVHWPSTYTNCLTANAPGAARLPMHFDSDRRVLEAALGAVMGSEDPSQARIMRIKSTLDLSQVLVSEAYRPQMEGRADLNLLAPPTDMVFNSQGDLGPWWR